MGIPKRREGIVPISRHHGTGRNAHSHKIAPACMMNRSQTAEWVKIFHVAQRLRAAQRSGYAIIMSIYVQIFIMFKINEQ